MLKTWTLDRFKSVYDRTELTFAPLTVFCGANSSGKSTVMQSLLLTSQTLQNPVPSRSVILNGHILKLGTFADVLPNESDKPSISIGFRVEPSSIDVRSRPLPLRHLRGMESLESVECSFSFVAAGAELGREIGQLQPRLYECELKVVARQSGKTAEDIVHIRRSAASAAERLATHNVLDEAVLVDMAALEFDVLKPQSARYARRYARMPRFGSPLGASLFHFLPTQLAVMYDAVEEEVSRVIDLLLSPDLVGYRESEVGAEEQSFLNPAVQEIVIDALGSLGDRELFERPSERRLHEAVEALVSDFSLQRLRVVLVLMGAAQRRDLTQRLAEKETELRRVARAGRNPVWTVTYVPLPELADHGSDYLRFFFGRMVRYLGPLRDEPKPVYPLAGSTDPRDVGYRGEHTAAVLELHRNTPVAYVTPAQLETGDRPLPVRRAGLAVAVLDWLGFLGVAHEVTTIDRGKLGHELKVTTGDAQQAHDLTHVGVGVSQVLPILVLSLLAEPGSVLVFEQPELHLHPRVQARLADFFVSLALVEKQCLIETHSEYLINRLRYRAVTSAVDAVADRVLLYFVEKVGPRSTYRPIRINEYGSLDDWPAGFFDEGEEQAAQILHAALKKRHTSKPVD